MKRIAIFGDVHGCIDELQELYKKLENYSIDEIRHSGDLVDRGPDSGAVVQFCREHKIEGVMGNHEGSLLDLYSRGWTSKSETNEKWRSMKSIRGVEDWEYLKNQPFIHVDDELKFVSVHGGLYPGLSIYDQPLKAVTHLQLINPNEPVGHTRWFHLDKKGVTEQEHRKNGWKRWYELYDGDYLCIYGHTVYPQPLLFNNTLGIDTGVNFGGKLTAVILPDMIFVDVKAKKLYGESRMRLDVESNDDYLRPILEDRK